MSGEGASPTILTAAVLERFTVRDALRNRDFGAVFRAMRQHQGATQAQIAAATGLSQGRVSKLMSDSQMRIAHIEVIERLADGLRIPGALLGLATRPWERDDEPVAAQRMEDGMLRRTALRTGGALLIGGLVEAIDSEPEAMNNALDTTNVSSERLGYFEATAERLGVDVVRVCPADVLGVAVNHFRSVRRLVRERQTTAHRVRLVRAGAKYATVVGEILFNQGNFELATMWYRTARHAALDVGDGYLADIALAGQAYIPTYGDDPRGVLRIVDARLAGSTGPTPAIAWLWGFKAKAHATLGDADQARRAIARSRTTLAAAAPELIRPGIFSFVPQKLALYEAGAHVVLGEAALATAAADRALDSYDMAETTEPALARFERASALVQSGEPDEACRLAAATVLDPRTYHSVSVRGRARRFDLMLTDQRSPAVRQWRAVMREVYAARRPAADPQVHPPVVGMPFA
jgi:transcriptional regulator with XRE-family HTH domain